MFVKVNSQLSTVKPTRCTNVSNFSMDKKPTRCHFCVILYFSFTSCSHVGTWLSETCWATCKGEIKDNTKVTSSWFLIHTELRCTANHTSVSNLFYFGMTLYMFRTVFPSIISSSRLYVLQEAFVKQILLDSSIVCTVLNCWWWTERPSETCRVSFQK